MLNNSLYQTIMRDYNRRQAEAKHAQDLRTREIFQNSRNMKLWSRKSLLCVPEKPGPEF